MATTTIRMTSHAHHYSPASGRYPQAIFDHGKPLALYHTKRLASPAQRIMLFAKDRGCTKPGCDAPAYHSQAHHVTAWTSTGIRMTSHAHHYSPASGRYPQAIFDHGTPLALYHTKRLASPAQRIMLFANDRGCTKPGCDAPAYHSQAHHVTAWTSTGRTDITELTLACDPDNRLAEKGWTTRKNTHGHTEWLPPPHLDHGQPRTNTFHHPERFLHNQDDDDKPD